MLGSQCGSALQGGYNVKEVYAELFVPILKDVPFVHALNLTHRRSLLEVQQLRQHEQLARSRSNGVRSKTCCCAARSPKCSVRRPSPTSSPSAASDAPKLSHDPCDHYTGNPANPACVNVPTDGSFVNQRRRVEQLQINGIASGSEFAGFPLGPEFGKSFDWGIVYDPHFIDGLSVSADYWRLYLNNNITASARRACSTSAPRASSTYCPLIHRYAVGHRTRARSTFINEPTGNLGRVDVKGVDFALNYRLPEFSFGRFNVGFNATYLEKYDISTAPGTDANTVYHYAGHFMTLRLGAGGRRARVPAAACACSRAGARRASVNWQLGAFDASWRMRYIGRFRWARSRPRRTCSRPARATTATTARCTTSSIDYGATVYNDIQFGYNLEAWNTRFDVGVNNVADKQPPFLYANNTLEREHRSERLRSDGPLLLGSRHGQVLRPVFGTLDGPHGLPCGPFFLRVHRFSEQTDLCLAPSPDDDVNPLEAIALAAARGGDFPLPEQLCARGARGRARTRGRFCSSSR